METIRKNCVTIVVGETGSGKTTRLPVFLYEADYAASGVIGITEPRRIAVTSVARYVCEQQGGQLGDVVGYQVRFDNQSEVNTPLKFMTDGILLRELQDDPDLTRYSVIMIDEAHERSQNIDFILGLLKDLLKRRTDLKVVVASATIDAQKFSDYFGGAPVVEVSGRMFPVEVVYQERSLLSFGRSAFEQLIEGIVKQIVSIHRTQPEGDILVFMTGQDDIHQVINGVNTLMERDGRLQDLVVLPCYGGLASEEQEKIFQRFPGKRKVVVATNIAETSLTVDGIVYVVDSGLIKQSHFHSESGIQSLDIVAHSQAGCNQRKGRAGRTRPGMCFRMYTQEEFEDRIEFTVPEIRRVSLAGVVLAMEDIGILNVEQFDFIDPPNAAAFHEAYQTLIALGAITPGERGITELGRMMAQLPLDPRTARMVLEANKYGCVNEVAIIASFLSAPHVFARPKGKESEADRAHLQFVSERSDLLSLLKVWRKYIEVGKSKDWCFKNFISVKALGEVAHVREQLLSVLERNGIESSETEDEDLILKSVTAGLIYNLIAVSTSRSYSGVFQQGAMDVFIHPGSSLFHRYGLNFVVPAEMVRTTKLFARSCTEVKVEWLRELAPGLFREEVTLLAAEEGGEAVAKKRLLFCHRSREQEIESKEVKVSLAEAREIQESAIAKAQADGWVQITFTRESQRKFFGGGHETWSSISEIELNVPYYCTSEYFLSKKYATPKFKVFPFLRRYEPVQKPVTEVKVVTPAKVVEPKPAQPEPQAPVLARAVLTLGGKPLKVTTIIKK